MPDLKKYLAELEIDGQLYQLKDATLTEQVTNLGQEINYVKNDIGDIKGDVQNINGDIGYLRDQINSISGVDPELLAEIEKIVAELEGSDNEASNAWITLVDKLKGLNGTVAENLATVQSNIDKNADDIYSNTNAITSIQNNIDQHIIPDINQINDELPYKVNSSDISEITFTNLKLSTADNLTNGYDSTNERLVFTTEQITALKYYNS